MQHSFETHKPVNLYAELGRGSLNIAATATTETLVEVTGHQAEEVMVQQDGDQISVIAPRQRASFLGGGESKLHVTITVPTDSNLMIKTGSADVIAEGSYGLAKIKSGSGDVRIDEATGHVVIDTGSGDVTLSAGHADLRVKSGSGDIHVDRAVGSVVISTGSGDVRLGSTEGNAVVKSGSGDLSVQNAETDLNLVSASGDLEVGTLRRGALSAKNASGDVRVGIPSGVPVWTDVSSVSGRIASDLVGAGQPQDGQDHIEVRARTVSGDIVLKQL